MEAALRLAALLVERGETETAERLYRETLEIYLRSNSPSDFDDDWSFYWRPLEELLECQGRIDELVDLARRQLTLLVAIRKSHPQGGQFFADLYWVGLRLEKKGRQADAEACFREAVKAEETLNHPIDYDWDYFRNRVVDFLANQGRMAEAEALCREGLEKRENALGKGAPHLSSNLRMLARLMIHQERPDEAEALLRRAATLTEKYISLEHAPVLVDLGRFLIRNGRSEEGEALVCRARTLEEATTLAQRAWKLFAAARLAEAEDACRRALSIREETLCQNHPEVICSLHDLAKIVRGLGRLTEAEELLRRALRMAPDAGREDWEIALIVFDLVLVRREQGHKARLEDVPVSNGARWWARRHAKFRYVGFGVWDVD